MELQARMGVRGPEPNHKCVLQARWVIWFFRPRLADCCAIPSFYRLHPATTSGPQGSRLGRDRRLCSTARLKLRWLVSMLTIRGQND